jgi:nitroreductase
MEVFEAIKKRRSIRKYLRKELEKEKLEKLLESARLAPSAKNLQPWKLVVVTQRETKEKLVDACKGQEFIADCSVFIVGVGNPEFKWHVVDTAIALEHVALEAVELGLGTCWIGAFEEEKVKEILKIPENLKVVACMAVGYPAEEPASKPKKPLDELISYETFS